MKHERPKPFLQHRSSGAIRHIMDRYKTEHPSRTSLAALQAALTPGAAGRMDNSCYLLIIWDDWPYTALNRSFRRLWL